jgi:Ca2+-binding RTX toxin-like protein
MLLRGTPYADVLVGTNEDDALLGLEGNDSLTGGPGADVILGGPGIDQAAYLDSAEGVSVDLSWPREQRGGDAEGDILFDIENLSGSRFDDFLGGDEGSNYLEGHTGRDTIIGGAGDDWASSDGIGDSFDGGAGIDTLRLSFMGRMTPVVVDLGTGFLSDGSSAVGFERLRIETGAGDDVIVGGNGNRADPSGDVAGDTIFTGSGNDRIVAGGGDDLVSTGWGDDIVDAGEGDDTVWSDDVDIFDAGPGNDFVAAGARSTVDGGAGDDHLHVDLRAFDPDFVFDFGLERASAGLSFRNFETLSVWSGDGDDVIAGGARDDEIDGSYGDDRLYGAAGDDTLDGGYGSDALYGGEGDDILRGGYQNDRLDGGAGDDRLDAGYGDDSLSGGAGDDWMDAGFGNDTAHGGEGDDRLDGGFGNDRLYGGAGDDVIDGRSDNDELSGYIGDDTLTGGRGADVFVFWGGNNGRDRVLDFNAAEGDVLRFSHSFLRDKVDLAHATHQAAEGVEIAWTGADGVTHGVVLVGVDLADFDPGRVAFA